MGTPRGPRAGLLGHPTLPHSTVDRPYPPVTASSAARARLLRRARARLGSVFLASPSAPAPLPRRRQSAGPGRAMVNQARDGADAGLTRTLPKHLAYAPLAARAAAGGEADAEPAGGGAQGRGAAAGGAAAAADRRAPQHEQYTHNVTSVVPLEEPLFQPSPPEVVFDTFEPLREYTTLLRFRNNDNVNRRIKILAPDSSAFTVEPPKALLSAGGGKVAPGMECTFKVHFAPKDAKDYYCELVCLTEREKFLVSVSARARARAQSYFGALLSGAQFRRNSSPFGAEPSQSSPRRRAGRAPASTSPTASTLPQPVRADARRPSCSATRGTPAANPTLKRAAAVCGDADRRLPRCGRLDAGERNSGAILAILRNYSDATRPPRCVQADGGRRVRRGDARRVRLAARRATRG